MKSKIIPSILAVPIMLTSAMSLAAGSEGLSPFPSDLISYRASKMDTNSDGVTSREEFMSDAEKRFELLDLNDDGKITTAERQEIRARIMKLRPE